MIGLELGGRYEILDRIGGGGMAIVYKGHDLLLHRNVAVKVLRQQYVHDEEFIRRFRREAQSAASLSHPNVVSIYDVGQQDEIHYIVMEYVEGMTLNDLIKDRAPLQVEEAVRIASQIADALEHAHAAGIIHRDIKPHNILIGRNGRIKVTDFGIARAATSSSITQTGSVIGSVHYFSPEHAKGTAAGTKSDLYSLGVVLYQMLTGRLPFLGESPISVALKHLQENVEEPRKVNPLIPQSLENIILKAMQKNPEDRFNSAKEMLLDLETCLLPGRRNEPKLEFGGAGADDPDELDEERTLVVPAIRPDAYGAAGSRSGAAADGKKVKKPWVKPTVWAVVLLAIIAALWIGTLVLKNKLQVNDVPIPNVVGMQLTDAQAELKKAGLTWEINSEPSPDKPKDTVVRQIPSAMSIKEGGTVKLYVSSGPELQQMPVLVGQKLQAARQQLVSMGVKEAQILEPQYQNSDTVPADTVISQDPKENTDVDVTKAQFKLVVSKGQQSVKMPDLVGLTEQEAKAKLKLNNLSVLEDNDHIIREPSFDQPAGKVFKQWPYRAGEEVAPGKNDIIIHVSAGMPKDAGVMNVTLQLPPAKEGTSSVFSIVLTDAQYDGVVKETLEVTKTKLLTMKVTVTKDKNAVIQINRDNATYDTVNVTYQDYLTSKTQPTTTPGGASAKPGGSPSPSAPAEGR